MLTMRKGFSIPFADKLSEGYKTDGKFFTANVSAQKTLPLLENFIKLHEDEKLFFIRVAINNVEILNFVKNMFGSICRENTRNARIKTTAENSGKSGFLETITVCPLPTILKVSLITGFVVRSIEIAHPGTQTGIHDGQILIRQSKIHDNIRLVRIQKLGQSLLVIGINLRSLKLAILDRVRLAIITSVKTSGFIANLCMATVATPPAPITKTFPMI